MAQQIMQVDEFVALHEERYGAFTAVFSSRNPPPVLKAVSGVDWWTLGALALLVVASVTVSGSRTVVEFGGGLIGVAAFVMLEVAMIAYAYWRAKRNGKQNSGHANRLSSIGMWLAFAVSLAANLHATLRQDGANLPDWMDTMIFISMAISAPSLALIAGDMLGQEAVAALAIREAAQQAFEADLLIWKQALNSSWDANKARWGVRVERMNEPDDSARIPADSGRKNLPQPESAPKLRNPREAAEIYYTDNPGALALKGAELVALARTLGISKTVMYEVRAARLEGAK